MKEDYISQLDETERASLQKCARSIIESRVSEEQRLRIKMESEYINRLCNGVRPKGKSELFSMSYCIAWQKGWVKTLDEWIENGFHRLPYDRKLNREESKYVQYKMGV